MERGKLKYVYIGPIASYEIMPLVNNALGKFNTHKQNIL